MKTVKKPAIAALLAALLLLLASCGLLTDGLNSAESGGSQDSAPGEVNEYAGGLPDNTAAQPDGGENDFQGEESSNKEDWKPAYNEYYYDVENVVLYLEAYDELPPNYITKEDANELGWTGGSVENYMDGGAIGGDRFGNYEGLLPKADGRVYTECDIDTDGYASRGSRRLVYSNDGLYFYTADHYESFTPVTVENGKVSLGE